MADENSQNRVPDSSSGHFEVGSQNPDRSNENPEFESQNISENLSSEKSEPQTQNFEQISENSDSETQNADQKSEKSDYEKRHSDSSNENSETCNRISQPTTENTTPDNICPQPSAESTTPETTCPQPCREHSTPEDTCLRPNKKYRESVDTAGENSGIGSEEVGSSEDTEPIKEQPNPEETSDFYIFKDGVEKTFKECSSREKLTIIDHAVENSLLRSRAIPGTQHSQIRNPPVPVPRISFFQFIETFGTCLLYKAYESFNRSLVQIHRNEDQNQCDRVRGDERAMTLTTEREVPLPLGEATSSSNTDNESIPLERIPIPEALFDISSATGTGTTFRKCLSHSHPIPSQNLENRNLSGKIYAQVPRIVSPMSPDETIDEAVESGHSLVKDPIMESPMSPDEILHETAEPRNFTPQDPMTESPMSPDEIIQETVERSPTVLQETMAESPMSPDEIMHETVEHRHSPALIPGDAPKRDTTKRVKSFFFIDDTYTDSSTDSEPVPSEASTQCRERESDRRFNKLPTVENQNSSDENDFQDPMFQSPMSPDQIIQEIVERLYSPISSPDDEPELDDYTVKLNVGEFSKASLNFEKPTVSERVVTKSREISSKTDTNVIPKDNLTGSQSEDDNRESTGLENAEKAFTKEYEHAVDEFHEKSVKLKMDTTENEPSMRGPQYEDSKKCDDHHPDITSTKEDKKEGIPESNAVEMEHNLRGLCHQDMKRCSESEDPEVIPRKLRKEAEEPSARNLDADIEIESSSDPENKADKEDACDPRDMSPKKPEEI